MNYDKIDRARWDASGNLSGSAVARILADFQPELTKSCGDYRWSLDGDCHHGYVLVAQDDRGQRWTDGRGRTPRRALRDWMPGWNVLRGLGIEI